jgi:hypothetical protein
MRQYLIYLFCITGLYACNSPGSEKLAPGTIPIYWVENLEGDFSFREKWEYPESVYKNRFAQLSCDGICPPEIDAMKDEEGRIYEDSLSAFYKLVDTTHQFFTIECEARVYEWSGTNFITATKINADTIICVTQNSISTHSRLRLTISGNTCTPKVEYFPIAGPSVSELYHCLRGYIRIEKPSWKKGILKADFYFLFDKIVWENQKMYWKGRIYTDLS